MKTNVQQTSIDAYHGINDMGQRQALVLYTIKELGKASDLDIANRLELPINRITPRRNELFAKGLIKEAKRDIHPFTGKRVIFWEVKDETKTINLSVQFKGGSYFHIVCGNKMLIKSDMVKTGDNSVRVERFIVCGPCNFVEKL